jgi:hypothetical protein
MKIPVNNRDAQNCQDKKHAIQNIELQLPVMQKQEPAHK